MSSRQNRGGFRTFVYRFVLFSPGVRGQHAGLSVPILGSASGDSPDEIYGVKWGTFIGSMIEEREK